MSSAKRYPERLGHAACLCRREAGFNSEHKPSAIGRNVEEFGSNNLVIRFQIREIAVRITPAANLKAHCKNVLTSAV
jgi:hypothetical protein